MSSPLTLILKVQPKNADELVEVYGRMTKNARDEDGTITYRMFRTGDGTAYFYDDYASSEAFLDHFQRAQDSGVLAAFTAAGDITEVLCLGTPNAAAKEVLAQFGATCADHVAGFSRLDMVSATP